MKVQSSTIENKYLRVKSINIGACLYEVYDKQKKINLILNLGPTKNYGSKNFYVGATCGRYAGRISNSKFLFELKISCLRWHFETIESNSLFSCFIGF